ncbi:50S ribosomal protein L18 [Candidatus Saccharibacteria bacterium]|nr:50S ribosomal protein L18 [Candidatus Saccharibacteria bacterium]
MRDSKTIHRVLKRKRVRAKVSGTPQRPRLSIHISLTAINAQLVDDASGKTLVAVNTLKQKSLQGKNLTDQAAWVGEQIATKAKQAKITTAVFDRGRHIYHGRAKALADSARKAGLKI